MNLFGDLSKHIKHPNRKTKTELESETEKLAQLLTDAKAI